ncbi:uncharacterized protein METZ01_LOCUS500977 [marine metagenome]|uniref:Uncharacterized protein n=1 Tax=marine metagenome TaxID=408172 RepID=A0A383DV34_9ZZZZ
MAMITPAKTLQRPGLITLHWMCPASSAISSNDYIVFRHLFISLVSIRLSIPDDFRKAFKSNHSKSIRHESNSY